MALVNQKLLELQARRNRLNLEIERQTSRQKKQGKKQLDRAKLLLGVTASIAAQNYPEFRATLEHCIERLTERDQAWIRGEGADVLAKLLSGNPN